MSAVCPAPEVRPAGPVAYALAFCNWLCVATLVLFFADPCALAPLCVIGTREKTTGEGVRECRPRGLGLVAVDRVDFVDFDCTCGTWCAVLLAATFLRCGTFFLVGAVFILV
jgi:hypothetical protein